MLIVFSLMGCADDEFINMEDIYIDNDKAYFIEDNSLVNGKVKSLGSYNRPGVLAVFSGRKTNYEGYYLEGLKDHRWLYNNPDESVQEGRDQFVTKIKEIWNSGELLKVEYFGTSLKLIEAKYYNNAGCPSTPIVTTDYIVQNNSSLDLILTIDEGVQRKISRNSNFLIGTSDHCESDLIPSENDLFKSIHIHKGDVNNNLVLLYTHNPIQDSMWIKHEKSNNNFEYTLEINDTSLKGFL